MIPSPEAVIQVICALNQIGVPYIITGSLARNLYAPPRSSQGADFVVEMSHNDLSRLFDALSEFLKREPQMSFETVTGKSQHKFIHPATQFS